MPFTGCLKTHQITTDDTYPRWLKFLINTSTINGFLEYDSDSKPVWTTDNSQIIKIKTFMNTSTNPDRLSEFDFSKDIPTILLDYDRVFSNFYAVLKDIVKSLEKKSRFNENINPQKLLAAIYKELMSLGSNINETQILSAYRDIVLNALGPDAPGGPNPFWLDCFAKLSETPTCTSRVEIELLIVTYWKNRVGNCYVNLLTDREPEFPSMGKLLVGAVLERTCVNCSKESNGRLRLAKTHDTGNCFYGDNVGNELLPGKGYRNKNRIQQCLRFLSSDAIKSFTLNGCWRTKQSSNSVYYDTGATKSAIKSKPDDFKAVQTEVGLAGPGVITTEGTGTLTFGSIKLDAMFSPLFTKNLASGIDIMKKGHYALLGGNKLVIIKEKLTIPDTATILATGTFDPQVGLIKLDHADHLLHIEESTHKKLGHLGKKMLVKTVKAVAGLSPSQIADTIDKSCEECIQGKMEHPKVAKSRRSTLNVIERLSIDLNFARINDHNGSKINIKIIDVFSRWIHFAPLLDKTPSSILRILQPFIARIERRTVFRLLQAVFSFFYCKPFQRFYKCLL